MGQSLESLSHKHRALNFVPRSHVKKLSPVACTCSPHARDWKQAAGHCPGLTISHRHHYWCGGAGECL